MYTNVQQMVPEVLLEAIGFKIKYGSKPEILVVLF